MKIAIFGSGNVGGALATGWAKAGHEIYLGLRDINNFKGKDLLQIDRISAHTISEAAEKAKVLLFATPPQVIVDIIPLLGDLSDKVVIDATNAIRLKPEPYATAYHAFADLSDGEVVKCFNTTGFENMKDPKYGPMSLDMFMAGESDQAKKIASQLSKDAGFEQCYDFGKADKVELLEQFALSWINLAIFQGMGRGIGFKVLKR
ncbi:MAG: NAD(P)-binding domain-containing protein [Bacteroidota bacterium]